MSEEQSWREEYRQEHGYFPEHHAMVREFPSIVWSVEGAARDYYIAGNGERVTKQQGKGPGHAWAVANSALARMCLRSIEPTAVATRYRHRRFPEHDRETMVALWNIEVDPLKWKQRNPPLFVIAEPPVPGQGKGGPMKPLHAALYSHLHVVAEYMLLRGAWCSDAWPANLLGGPSVLDFYLDNS